MVLYNHAMFAEGVQRLDCSRSLQERVKWLAVLMTPRVASQVPLWFVVNHWQSPLSGASSPASRQNCWSEFSFFFQNEARMVADGLLVGGDFNIEPGDPPFVNQSGATLQPTRERQLVLRDRRNSSYLYNPMWRFMGEPEPHEDTLTEGYLPSRPLGTYLSGSGWRLYDQMFVSKSLLAGAYYHLLERTVRISLPQNACSDHCAIGARFGITEVR